MDDAFRVFGAISYRVFLLKVFTGSTGRTHDEYGYTIFRERPGEFKSLPISSGVELPRTSGIRFTHDFNIVGLESCGSMREIRHNFVYPMVQDSEEFDRRVVRYTQSTAWKCSMLRSELKDRCQIKDSEAFSQHVLIFNVLRNMHNLNLNYAISKSKCFNCLVGKVFGFKIIPVYILFETFIFHKQLNIISLTDFN